MPYAVAIIGVSSFLAGLATAGGHYVIGGLLVSVATATAFWLRWWTLTTIDHAFQEGAGYGESTRRRIRELPEAHDVPKNLKRKKWLNGSSEDK